MILADLLVPDGYAACWICALRAVLEDEKRAAVENMEFERARELRALVDVIDWPRRMPPGMDAAA